MHLNGFKGHDVTCASMECGTCVLIKYSYLLTMLLSVAAGLGIFEYYEEMRWYTRWRAHTHTRARRFNYQSSCIEIENINSCQGK